MTFTFNYYAPTRTIFLQALLCSTQHHTHRTHYILACSWILTTLTLSCSINKRFQQTDYVGTIRIFKEVISVLGRILFLIYVNDLLISLTSTCADIVADETTLGTSSHSIDTLVETLTTDLQNVVSWCNSNNMSLNVSKTNLCISHLDTNSRLFPIVIMI